MTPTHKPPKPEILWMVWHWLTDIHKWKIAIHMTNRQRITEILPNKLDRLTNRKTLTELIGPFLETKGYIFRYGVMQDAGIMRGNVGWSAFAMLEEPESENEPSKKGKKHDPNSTIRTNTDITSP